MPVSTGYDDVLNINATYRLIERYTRSSLAGAISYLNAERDLSGHENYKRKWFQDIDVLSWSLPFFRHIDGHNHTHFVIDIDIRLAEGEKQYVKYLDRLRILKLAAAIEYFRGWVADHADYEFFWKVGGTGLHAIQFIEKRVSRKNLQYLVTDILFPKCRLNKMPDDIKINPAEYRKHIRRHRCDTDCTGWHYSYSKNKKTGYYEKNKFNWIKFYNFNGTKVVIHIDLTMYHWDRINIRWVYSPVFKIPQRTYFSIPLEEWNIEWVVKHSTLDKLDKVLKPFEIPIFQFEEYVDFDEVEEDEWIIDKTPKKIKTGGDSNMTFSEDYITIANNLYQPEQANKIPTSLNRLMDRMTAEFHHSQVSPCIQRHYEIASTQRRAHWNRFPIIRFLMWQGYTGIQVANWIRFRLNDDEDNTPENQHKLMLYLPSVIGNIKKPNPIPRCHTLQSSKSNFHICDEDMQMRCGRNHPLHTKTLKTKTQYIEIDTSTIEERPKIKAINPIAIREGSLPKTTADIDRHWKAILDKMNDVLNLKENLVLWKSTRAGVTTTIIYAAKQRGKKLLVLVPTNKIAMDTFQTAINIVKAKTNQIVNGAVLSSNVKSCLILRFTEKELRRKKKANPNWGNWKLAWNKLLYHTKPTCKGCRFKNATASLPLTKPNGELIPLYESKVSDFDKRQGWCAYQTFRKHLKKLDVVFLTYAKLNSIRTASSKENKEILQTFISEFDILFLDEINTVAQASPLSVRVLSNPQSISRMDESIRYDFFAKLRTELDELMTYTNPPTTNTNMIKSFVTKFIKRFESLKLRDWSVNNVITHNNYDIVQDNPTNPLFRHPLKYGERELLREKFGKYHILLENYTKDTNQLLWGIERVLVLMSNNEIVGYNLPRYNAPYLDYQMVVSPNIREVRGYVREFDKGSNNSNQIIATDACLPEANISDLLGIPFKDFIVGDPRQTNKHQLIIADLHQVYSSKFLRGTDCKYDKCEYWNTDNQKCKLTITYTTNRDGRDIFIEEAALHGDHSFKDQFMFLKDLQSIINTFGPKNVFVIFPNKATFAWFKKHSFRLTNIKHIKTSYYRSDLTIGVECDRRVMVTLGSPIPPMNSYLWLAYYYHRMNLLQQFNTSELAERLRLNSMRSSFWQTVGRAKDPLGIERSIVFSWGLGSEALIEAFRFHSVMAESLPNYKAISTQKEHKVTDLLHMGNVWRRHGLVLDIDLLKLSKYLSRSDRCSQWFTARELFNLIRFPTEKIKNFSQRVTEKQLLVFNLEIKEKKWGADIKYLVRSTVPPPKKQPNRRLRLRG